MNVLFVLIDGLRADTARAELGFMQGLCEAGLASSRTVTSELPSLSRPLYHCLLSGTAPLAGGIVHNDQARVAREDSVFSLAAAQGLTTAASAYHWMSELYNRAPYDALRDRFTDDASLPIQHAVFYSRDEYPDETVISDGERLRRLWQPDFLLIHTMNVDDAGHRFGADSLEYRIAAVEVDRLLSLVVPQWLAEGYQVVVASDHGMRGVKHGGNSPEERETLLFTAGKGFSHTPGVRVRQTEICGTVCELLGLAHDKPCCKELLG